MSIVVVEPGLVTSVQDRGRSGMAAFGVGCAGPMDDVAFRLANALVGNDADAAALECALLGPTLRFESPAWIALTGADFGARADTRELPCWQTLEVAAGDTIELGNARRGAVGYLAIAGGIASDRVLGSRATDLGARIGAFGGRALRAGDVLAIGAQTTLAAADAARTSARRGWSLDPRPWFDADPRHALHVIRGSHFDALDSDSQRAFYAAQFHVGAQSNRVGIRLQGVPLTLEKPLELVSEAVATGTLQLPPGGTPIALAADHPTVGGYPRIGQIAAIDLPRLAQRRPGAAVRFREIDRDDAQTRYLLRERELARLCEAITQRLQA